MNYYFRRTKLLFWMILFSLCTFSQVKEDFSDGNFTENPPWSGNVDRFQVNKALQLRLNDKVEIAGNSYLSTPSVLVRNTEWNLYVHLYFNPSANNYAKFYLTSTNADLNAELDGYFLLIGGAQDHVALYRQQGEEIYPLIIGASKMIGKSSPELQIRVTCDKQGVWKLYTQLLNEDSAYVEEGSAIDTTLSSSSHCGLVCIYTASRNTAFAFDDIFIGLLDSEKEEDQEEEEEEQEDEEKEKDDDDDKDPTPEPEIPEEPKPDPDPDDVIPPILLGTYALNDSTLLLTFNEEVSISKALFRLQGNSSERERELLSDKRSVKLFFKEKFSDHKEYTLLISGVEDISGNIMGESWIRFTYYDTSLDEMSFRDIVFSEVMANPTNVNDLPEVEYVEIYNRSDQAVNLNNWKFYYGSKAYSLTETYILPDSYLVLCHEKEIDKWDGITTFVKGVKSFPVLANTGKLIWLEDARGNLISWVEYANEWHEDDFKKKGGFSLECIDVNNLTGYKNNWTSSKDSSGGTPGRENSVKGLVVDERIAKISYAYLQNPDSLIIQFSKPMDFVSLADQSNYTLTRGAVFIKDVIPVLPVADQVKIVLSDSLNQDDILEIELKRLRDISGFDLEGNLVVRTGLPQEALEGELLFNEILFNPFPGGNDYVEIYNNSSKYINLNRLFFTSRKNNQEELSEGILLCTVPRVLSPYSYACFTKDIETVCSQYECLEENMISINKLPSLPDTKGNIIITNLAGEIIDEMSYTDKMHTALLDDKEGISLEKISPEKASDISFNWLSASSASGGGTPGTINSQYRSLEDHDSQGFWLEKKAFSPDGDGYEDELSICYSLTDENMQATIRIYDNAGRLVNTIVNNFRLEETGIIIWDGKDQNDKVVEMGLYIIYIEAYNPAGKMKKYKLGCAVTR